MDILNLPSDCLEKNCKIFIDGIEDRTQQSIYFIKNEYEQKELLYKMIEFMQYHFCNMMKSDINHIDRIDNFPINEAHYELHFAFNHALIGSYKAAFADLRRSLEMSLTIPFFTIENYNNPGTLKEYKDENLTFGENLWKCFEDSDNQPVFEKYMQFKDGEIKKANDWVKGNSNTPFFGGGMLKELIKTGRFKDINDECRWKGNLENLYHKISDYGHNKGYKKSYNALNSPSSFINSIPIPTTKIETLKEFCDLYIETVQQNLVILSLYNPLVLEGLPIEQKFGFNEPASGFFSHYESELLWELLPKDYHAFFEKIRTTDNEVLDIVKWVMERPDVSQEEFENQIEQYNSLVKNLFTKDK